ncbi:carbon-nitrogen hydrolase family protein [Candidatus Fermentibacteria bacterium]|nr:carbon-nitrogen hydrolase family protein [Candidatus Fermentibacteria bacterium]
MHACSFPVAVESRTTRDCQQPTRTLRVGAIQIESQPGRIEANHARATAMVEEAARSGAELVVLPELFACGYVPNKVIWDYAEPLAGPTATWLRETSRRLGVYLGAGMTETDGADFFNAYLITAPDGEIAGHIRETMAEAYCFKRSKGSHIVDTAIGRIGIGICADNHYTRFAGLIQAGSVDLMLMPHAWPTPFKTSGFVSEGDVLKAENGTASHKTTAGGCTRGHG